MNKLLFLCFFIVQTACAVFERPIVVVTASYNNINWVKKNLDSIFTQKYDNFYLIYIDDCSTDGTGAFVQEYVKNRGLERKIKLIVNPVRKGALHNHYHAIHSVSSAAVIIILDGDDFFIHEDVLSTINQAYADRNIWLTYGQFREWPSDQRGFCCQYPEDIIVNNAFREYGHTPSHLRTYYAWLFKLIKKEDLFYEGDFFAMDADIATMFPMVEMAREGHFKFIEEELCLYNAENCLNDHKVSKELQVKLDQEIRSRKRYDKVQAPEFLK